MSEYRIQDTTLTGIADAIRLKTGSSAPIVVNEMANEIESIPTGGSVERNKTVQRNLGFIDLENDSRVTLPNGLVWTKSSTYKFGTEEGYNSPSIDDSSSTTQELTFTPEKDGMLTILYACTSETGYDYLNIAVDGSTKVEKYTQGKTEDYTWEVLKLNFVANQAKTIVFTYLKDDSSAYGYDKAGFLISFWE